MTPANPPGRGTAQKGKQRTRVRALQHHSVRGALRTLIPAILVCISVLAPSADAVAQRKTDVITLYNGDRITGEIKALQQGLLALGTDAMGTVEIEWREIASIDSKYNYEVRLSSGQRFFGSVGQSDKPGVMTLADVFGEQLLNSDEVVEMRPVEDEFIKRLDLDLSFNYAFTKASGVRQTEFIGNLSYDEPDATNRARARFTVSDTDENNTSSSRISLERRRWTDRQSVFRALFAISETNDELGLNSRLSLGGGFGRYFVDTNNGNFSAGLALNAITERSVDGVQQESLEAVIFADLARRRFQSPELDLIINGTLYPSLTESGRVRADTSAQLRWEIYSDLFWNLNAWGSYDNAQVDGEGSEWDWGITTGLGWSF